eukprot:TRINITY_DN76165_c0_g1_i1.p1 TRINITY_DN76165_c0_g1~~TRINITY_DN76165_c0_g1_i1.p1  ORF type:complete len:162 (-),score=15.34 TRINITY_DN76165_c0_g1_i1:45-500(-)
MQNSSTRTCKICTKYNETENTMHCNSVLVDASFDCLQDASGTTSVLGHKVIKETVILRPASAAVKIAASYALLRFLHLSSFRRQRIASGTACCVPQNRIQTHASTSSTQYDRGSEACSDARREELIMFGCSIDHQHNEEQDPQLVHGGRRA